MKNKYRIAARVDESTYKRLHEINDENISEAIRTLCSTEVKNDSPSYLKDLKILPIVFDLLWDELPKSTQKRLIKETKIQKAGEVIDAIRKG